MVELIEYSLVVLVSTLFVAGSVVSYGSFSDFETGVSLRSEFSAVSELAQRAVWGGTTSAYLQLPESTISCQGGTLAVSAGSFAQQTGVGVPCGFSIHVTGGGYTLRFDDGPRGLSLLVT